MLAEEITAPITETAQEENGEPRKYFKLA